MRRVETSPSGHNPVVRNLNFLTDIRVVAVSSAAAEFSPVDTVIQIWFGRAFEWFDNCAVVWVIEKREGVPVRLAHSLDAVECRTVLVIGPNLKHVANIDDKGIFNWFDVVPVVVFEDLQPTDVVLNQNGDSTCITMMMNAQVGTSPGFLWNI